MLEAQDIYSYIRGEEETYSLPITVIDGYDWSMQKHINLTVLYKNSIFESGNNDDKPFKNIIRPILNLQYRAEGFDVKDIELFVNSRKEYYKSFLIKKFHDKWARDNEIDSFIDDMVETYIDFGGVLVKHVEGVKPEVIPWQNIAFCDQTDILAGPFAIKHFYSPDQLKEMEDLGWGNEQSGATATIDELITLSKNEKTTQQNKQQIKTPGKYIEVYEVHGNMPAEWVDGKEGQYLNQMHIVAFYHDRTGAKQGVTLFKGREKKDIFKFLARDKVHGRTLGTGGAEELFEPQVWINYDLIRIKGMLDQAAKIIYQTSDDAYASRNKINDLENGEITVVEDGKAIQQINTSPVNLVLFEKSVAEWEAHAQQLGSANDSIMGENPASGTPFKLQELVTQESHSLHEYRKGKLARFLDEIYRDWIIPYLSREAVKGTEFLAELEHDEMQAVAESVVTNEANKLIVEKILNGELVMREEIEDYKLRVRQSFMKGGNKKFIEILKDEMKDAPIDIYTNIAGKQKDLAGKVDKLVNVFRAVLQNPQMLQNPVMGKLFNEILEYSGLSPIDFAGLAATAPQQVQEAPVEQILKTPALQGLNQPQV